MPRLEACLLSAIQTYQPVCSVSLSQCETPALMTILSVEESGRIRLTIMPRALALSLRCQIFRSALRLRYGAFPPVKFN